MGVQIAAPGGKYWSHEADTLKGLDIYLHLVFFRNTHLMEYTGREERRIKDSIILQISPEVLDRDGVMFAADVSNKVGVTIHSLEDANEMIDFNCYILGGWRDPPHRLA